MYKLSIIMPVHNEEESINDFYCELIKYIKIKESEIVFIDDGSDDNSLDIMKNLQKKDKRIKIIQFSKNFGQQAAIRAGLSYINGDVAIVMDADLQDHPKYIPELIEKWKSGYQVVFAKRRLRLDSFFKKASVLIFYKILNLVASKIDSNVGDFYLLDKKAIEKINAFKKKTIFLRGFIQGLGFKQGKVLIDRDKRHKGKSSYSFLKMVRLGFDAFISLPRGLSRLILLLAIFILAMSSIFLFLFFQNLIAVTILIFILDIFQLFLLTILFIYLNYTIDEIRKKPLYITKNIYDLEDE
ncbi:hypothetical protein COX95_00915 [bacterium CG_4_10_14_0_2_um_filter_33_32]|nr:MAG: hypothetical protein COS74_01725 [bacterium CG06_land_8_20_14_3_00_33_50]PIY84978.1 MAG: hypothetical protein COY76_04525 [bacterium CG_4_10_14_0_8_um_filter_33_57]PIZ86538.1 MAG: hypothetical protein COX95_00915 [bacterium CG_4_10_14_0_2_um_filter_33_32]PJA72219.1 MAG: hypothetical protein CO152_02605 [bacterium CG_4_9_14_3_um_filter_33_26]